MTILCAKSLWKSLIFSFNSLRTPALTRRVLGTSMGNMACFSPFKTHQEPTYHHEIKVLVSGIYKSCFCLDWVENTCQQMDKTKRQYHISCEAARQPPILFLGSSIQKPSFLQPTAGQSGVHSPLHSLFTSPNFASLPHVRLCWEKLGFIPIFLKQGISNLTQLPAK